MTGSADDWINSEATSLAWVYNQKRSWNFQQSPDSSTTAMVGYITPRHSNLHLSLTSYFWFKPKALGQSPAPITRNETSENDVEHRGQVLLRICVTSGWLSWTPGLIISTVPSIVVGWEPLEYSEFEWAWQTNDSAVTVQKLMNIWPDTTCSMSVRCLLKVWHRVFAWCEQQTSTSQSDVFVWLRRVS